MTIYPKGNNNLFKKLLKNKIIYKIENLKFNNKNIEKNCLF